MRIAPDHQHPALPATPHATQAEAPAQAEAAAQADLPAAPCADEHAYAVHRGIDWFAAYKRASIEATDTGDTADTGHHLCADTPSPAPAATTVACDAPTTSEPEQLTPPRREKTILEMSDAELQALPAERKRALLASLGVADKHLTKTKGAKLDAAFSQAVSAMKTPGQHKLTLKLDKKYELKVRVGSDGEIVDAAAKQKKGFFSKLGSVLKMVAPILGIVLAPLTGGLSLVISSALGAIEAAKNKNWLGMVASVAGAFVPGTGSFLSSAVGAAGKTAALAGQTVARVASVVQQGAYAAQAAMMALRAKSPGALLGAIAGGVGAVAGGMGQAGERLGRLGERLQTWSRVVGGGEQVLRAVRSKDYLGAAAGALGTASGLTKGEVSQNLARYRGWVSSANSVQWGLRTKNYLAAAQGGLGLARDLRQPLAGLEPNKHDRVGERLDQAMRLVQGASYLASAVKRKDAAGIAQAGLVLGGAAASIGARYVVEGGVGSREGSQMGEGLYRAARMVGWAEQAARAAKSKDYAGAAAASLGLAAAASEHNRYATAERIAEGAASLVTALRSGNTLGIQAATSALMGRVTTERHYARAAQQELVKDAGQAEGQPSTGAQPSARKVAPLLTLRPFAAASVEKMLAKVEWPTLPLASSTMPLVDVASLGEPPPPLTIRLHANANQTTPHVQVVKQHAAQTGAPPSARTTPPQAQLVQQYEDAIHVLLPPGAQKLSETQVLISATKHIYQERGMLISNAAAEEIVGRGLAVIDHTDKRDTSAPDYVRDKAGNLMRDQSGQPLPAHRVYIDDETKHGLLEFKDEALRITKSGVPAVREMTLEQRYERVLEIYHEQHASASDRQAFDDIFSWQNIGVMAVVEGSLLTPAGPVVVGTLGAKFLVADLPKLQQEAVAVKRLIYSPNKVSDLEEAAARMAVLRTTGKVVAGTAILGGVARAGAKLAGNTAAGVQLPEIIPSGRAVVTEGGARLPFKMAEPGPMPTARAVVAGVAGEATRGTMTGGTAGATVESARGVGSNVSSVGKSLEELVTEPHQMAGANNAGGGRAIIGRRAGAAEIVGVTEELAARGVRVVKNADKAIDKVNPRANAAFDYGKGELLLRKDATFLEVFHEKTHALQWAELGKEGYKAKGTLAREEHVYETIMANKQMFSQRELELSERVIQTYRIRKSRGEID